MKRNDSKTNAVTDLSLFAKPQQQARNTKKSVSRGRIAVIYTRVSTKEQADTNQSLDTQLEKCTSYAERHGYEVVGEFGGTYESAKNDERKEFKRMLDFVKKSRQQIGFIIVYSHDRFSRSGSNAIHIVDQLSQMGIAVVAVSQPIDTFTSTGKLQQGIQFLFSQFDNDQRREKCITGMQAKLRKGYWSGKAPVGYDQATVNGEQKITPNKTGKLIKLAFELKAEKGLTNTEIIKRLEAQGLKLYNQTLTKIFLNPFYCGLICSTLLEEGEVVEGKHASLISRELFLMVNGLTSEHHQGYTQTKQDPFIFLEEYISSYEKKDKRVMEAMRKSLIAFTENPAVLPFSEVTPRMCTQYRSYLEKKCNGETPYNYFKKFRKILKQAVSDGIIATNPAAEIENRKVEGIKKEVLSMEEIQKLAKVGCGNPEVRRAFLFSCITGLRFCDVKPLEWKSIKGTVIRLNQQKTGKEVVVNLNSTAMNLLGLRPKQNQLIFTLPSHTACSKNLQNWADKAKLDKKVTWHCARHSFGTNLLISGADIRSVSGLLGHSNLIETQKYVRLVEALKEKAVEQLPEIDISL